MDDGTVEGIVKFADGKQLDDALDTFPAAWIVDAVQSRMAVANSMPLKRDFIFCRSAAKRNAPELSRP